MANGADERGGGHPEHDLLVRLLQRRPLRLEDHEWAAGLGAAARRRTW